MASINVSIIGKGKQSLEHASFKLVKSMHIIHLPLAFLTITRLAKHSEIWISSRNPTSISFSTSCFMASYLSGPTPRGESLSHSFFFCQIFFQLLNISFIFQDPLSDGTRIHPILFISSSFLVRTSPPMRDITAFISGGIIFIGSIRPWKITSFINWFQPLDVWGSRAWGTNLLPPTVG